MRLEWGKRREATRHHQAAGQPLALGSEGAAENRRSVWQGVVGFVWQGVVGSVAVVPFLLLRVQILACLRDGELAQHVLERLAGEEGDAARLDGVGIG